MKKTAQVVLSGSQRTLLPGSRVIGLAGSEEWIEVTVKLRRKRSLPELTGRPATTLTRAELEEQYGASQADIDQVAASVDDAPTGRTTRSRTR